MSGDSDSQLSFQRAEHGKFTNVVCGTPEKTKPPKIID